MEYKVLIEICTPCVELFQTTLPYSDDLKNFKAIIIT